MAITYIETDTDRLSSDISELKENTSQAKSSLEALKAELDELNTMWKGSASQAFQSASAQDYNLMLSMLKTMDSLADCMENAKKEYNSCEQQVRSTVNSIRI
ncbi:MAG: WXG100 family type VII secretion target [Lachnospiraceae bacterium]|nr:WXG100 family type VII secretion target [Lachnospiraceae bacterium]